MCNERDLDLSLDGEAFSLLKQQWNAVINRTIGNMQMKGADEAQVTLKMQIKLESEIVDTPDGTKDAVIPKFRHEINSVMQVKDRASGELVDDYQLVWDEDEQKYVLRAINDGQMDIFTDYEVVDDDDELDSLPAHEDYE